VWALAVLSRLALDGMRCCWGVKYNPVGRLNILSCTQASRNVAKLESRRYKVTTVNDWSTEQKQQQQIPSNTNVVERWNRLRSVLIVWNYYQLYPGAIDQNNEEQWRHYTLLLFRRRGWGRDCDLPRSTGQHRYSTVPWTYWSLVTLRRTLTFFNNRWTDDWRPKNH
jgi:hypothetical protein